MISDFNIRKTIHIVSRIRRTGVTTALIEAAKKHDATVICHSEHNARMFRDQGVKAISIHRSEQLLGRSLPVLFDKNDVERMFFDMFDIVDEQSKYIKELESRLDEKENLCCVLNLGEPKLNSIGSMRYDRNTGSKENK